MKSKVNEITQRILVLLKLDAKRLFERIKHRAPEYMYIFSVKRTRDHFPAVFKNRYDDLDIDHLKHCSQDVLIGLDQFYSKVDEMRWYVNATEDMPGTVEDKINSHIRELETLYETLNLYIDAELGTTEAPSEVDEGFSADFSSSDGEELSTEVSDDLLKELSS